MTADKIGDVNPESISFVFLTFSAVKEECEDTKLIKDVKIPKTTVWDPKENEDNPLNAQIKFIIGSDQRKGQKIIIKTGVKIKKIKIDNELFLKKFLSLRDRNKIKNNVKMGNIIPIILMSVARAEVKAKKTARLMLGL